MKISKIVITTIDDAESVKTTEVVEYGPFDTTKDHPLDVLIDFLTKDKLPEIITNGNMIKKKTVQLRT